MLDVSSEPPVKRGKLDGENKPTLTYWNGRGLCEQVRFMLAACDVDYDEAVPGVDDISHLSDSHHFEQLKAQGNLAFDQVPLLCIDGLHLVQSGAIVRYLAKKHGLVGTSLAHEAMCDVVHQGIRDWHAACGIAFEFNFGHYAPSAEELAKFRQANSKYLPLLERIAVKSDSGFIMEGYGVAGLTYCDVALAEVLDQNLMREPALLENYPGLAKVHANLRDQVWLKNFLASNKRKTKKLEDVEPYKASVNRTLQR